jgi:hypothetical protein
MTQEGEYAQCKRLQAAAAVHRPHKAVVAEMLSHFTLKLE